MAEALKHGNDEIKSLLLPATISGSALLLRASVLTEKLSVTVALVKSALGKLHKALAKLDGPTDTNRHGDYGQKYHLSVQLREDSEVNRKQLL